jgi:hypothetical protein
MEDITYLFNSDFKYWIPTLLQNSILM